ncbi:F-box protein At1g47340-like [Salvia hispanica]|uniref:F-box protein At1g47340-like n=1 Tax=Salvia hispanica TaxID=49212 RepID=UPI00200933D0|nr:F-box protein At1g47340-like [Salvia hispanica]
MGRRDFFINLPSVLTTNILSRLPLRTLAISKCVCKPWRNLLCSLDFAKSLLSDFETPPDLACLTPNYRLSFGFCKYRVEESWTFEYRLSYNGFDLNFGDCYGIESDYPIKVFNDGDILMLMVTKHIDFYYQKTRLIYYSSKTGTIEQLGLVHEHLGPIDESLSTIEYSNRLTEQLRKFEEFYGFGMSKNSGQYKVLCTDVNASSDSYRHVYTLGTGTWRRVEADDVSGIGICSAGYIVFNGILHWIGGEDDLALTLWVCGFDLETECFDIFSPPPPPPVDGRGHQTRELSTLRDCLCYSYTWEDDIVIWLMKVILYKISRNGFDIDWDFATDWKYMGVTPIKLFKDGDILMLLDEKRLIYYSSKTRTIQQVGMLNDANA